MRSGHEQNNNVNPSQYKVAGRERQGEGLAQEKSKQVLAKSKDLRFELAL